MKSTVQLLFILNEKHSEGLFPLLTDQQEPAASLTSMKDIWNYFHCRSPQLFFWFRLRLWSGWWSERRSITQTTPGGSQRSSGNTTPTSSGVSSLTSTLSSWVIEICLRSSHTVRFITSCGHFWSLHCLCFQELLQKTSSPSRSFRFQSCLIYGEHNASVPLSEHTVNISNNLVWCPSGSWATSTRTVLSLSQSSALPFIWSWPGKIVTLFLKHSPPRWDPALWNKLWLQHHPLRYEI